MHLGLHVVVAFVVHVAVGRPIVNTRLTSISLCIRTENVLDVHVTT